MTAPAERETPLWVTDEELIRLLGCGVERARRLIQIWDHDKSKGFPQKQELFGGRRYMPAVRAYFDAIYIPKITAVTYPRRVV